MMLDDFLEQFRDEVHNYLTDDGVDMTIADLRLVSAIFNKIAAEVKITIYSPMNMEDNDE